VRTKDKIRQIQFVTNFVANKKGNTNMAQDKIIEISDGEMMFVDDMRNIISTAKEHTYKTANLMIVVSNWLVGRRIVLQEQNGKDRAEYGKRIISIASQELTRSFGKGYGETTLRNYRKFYLQFCDMQIQQPLLAEFKKGNLSIRQSLLAESDADMFELRPQLSWMHYERLMRVDDKQARIWYMNAAADNQWSYRTLGRNISTQYYYRLMQTPPNLQKKVIDEMVDKTKAFQNDKLDFIKNPVVAEFLGLPQNSAYNENKLESAIINHIQEFIMEMGRGFAFVARQQHIRTDMGDFFIDLVFYNYVLKCFLLVDLKIGQITHQDVGQMDMYVRMYDKLKCTEGDHPTVGLILCSDTSKDMAQYSILNDNKHIYQAKYLTFLPTKEELAREIERQKEIFKLQHGEEENNK
jgi:predicted nuclease of restriction endonuclease-like (RecB) superfamily